jgi:hypothetical protein
MMFAHQKVTQDATLATTLMVGLGCRVICCTSATSTIFQAEPQCRTSAGSLLALNAARPHFHFLATCIRKKNCDSNVEGEKTETQGRRESRG